MNSQLDPIGSDQAIVSKIISEQVNMHCARFPVTSIAQTLGGLYLLFILWDGVVSRMTLITGAVLLALLQIICIAVFSVYRKTNPNELNRKVWQLAVIGTSLALGAFWGSAAIFLYPPLNSSYLAFVILLLAILPFVPVVAYAGYLPAFFAYYIPCTLPLVFVLASQGDRAGIAAALLFSMLVIAAMVFAVGHNKAVVEAIRLRLQAIKQNDELERINRAKSTFFASAGHDLRQPLQTLSLLIDALKYQAKEPEVIQTQQLLARSSDDLHQLVDSLLDISKLDAGTVSVDKQTFPLGGILQKLAVDFLLQAKAKGLSLSVVSTSVVVHTDAVLLERVLRNLIDNALRYTHTGGILIGCRRGQGSVRVCVMDTGIGISDSSKERIFEEFVQLENVERDRRKGLGLGLAIVKRLLELLGHKLEYSSVDGRGSEFSVQLPVAEMTTEKAQRIDSSPKASTLSGRLLVCIDDEPSIREAMERLATAWGCRIITAADADSAVEQLRRQPGGADLLIVDYRLRGGSSGIEAANQLIANSGALPVIIITGDTATGPLQAASDSGFRLLHKPLKPGQLQGMIVQELHRHESPKVTLA